MKQIDISIDGRAERYRTGTAIKDMLGEAGGDPIAAVLNFHLVSLDTVLTQRASVTLVQKAEAKGREVLRCGAQLAFQSLLKAYYPDLTVEIGQSLLGGYFYQILSSQGEDLNLTSIAGHLNDEMQNLIERDEPFFREHVSLEQVLNLVDDPTGSRAKLLRTWPAPRAYVVSVNNCFDIQHSVAPPSTRHLKGVEVLPFAPGLVLRFGPCCDELHPGDSKLLLDCYQETSRWNEMIEVGTVGELNASILGGSIDQVVRLSEAWHEKKIAAIADQICEREDLRVVCIAGPSSSGKSTFLKRLAIQLRVNGRRTLTISLDDYYRGRGVDEQVDLESPEALDLELLREQLARLVEGRVVHLPRFDFVRQRPVLHELWKPVKLESNHILLLEGLHALNPLTTSSLPKGVSFRVFVSALSQLIIDEHNRIPTSEVRLLRRITRDRKFRGSTTVEILEQWPRVREAERRYIFPFQEQVDCLFDSSLVYEAAVLKSFTWRYLMEVPREHPTQMDAFGLLKFLELFVPILSEIVPSNSLLREFVGLGPGERES